MTTIYDVSKRAGVSPATVSRVLNDNPKVDPALKRRVIEAVRELHFVPNGSARSLVTKRTERVALLLPDITNPYYPELARGAQDALDGVGYHLILSNTDDDPARELRYLQMLGKAGIDGLIIAPASSANGKRETKQILEQRTLQLTRMNIPMVTISPDAVVPDSDQVTVDEAAAAAKAVEHLVGLGHVRVALINGPRQHPVSERRQLGFVSTLAQHGVPVADELIRYADFRRVGGRSAMLSLLELAEPPSAVFAANDLMAFGAMSAIHEAGLQIPKDVAIASVDNTAEASDADPPLTTVSVPRIYEYGRLAAELLLDRFQRHISGEEPSPPKHVTLDTRLFVRGSTVPTLSRWFEPHLHT